MLRTKEVGGTYIENRENMENVKIIGRSRVWREECREHGKHKEQGEDGDHREQEVCGEHLEHGEDRDHGEPEGVASRRTGSV